MAWFKRKKNGVPGFYGDFQSWEEARKVAGGYDEPGILAKTEAATRKILEGRAVFERDSVLLPVPEYPWPLLACLLEVATFGRGRLSVLDFGGALGSTYYQCRSFLGEINDLTWAVVEQKHYVESGRKEFAHPPVVFHFSAQEAHAKHQSNLLLLSSVLPYLPDPSLVLEELLALGIPRILMDRIPLYQGDRDRLTVQRVSPEIYQATYPAWFFSRGRLLGLCDRFGYRPRAEWTCSDNWPLDGKKANFQGFYLEKTS